MATNLTNNPTPFTSLAAGATGWDSPLDTWIAAASADIAAVAATADAAATAATTAAGTVAASRIADGSLPLTKLATAVAPKTETDAIKATADNAAASAAAAVTAASAPPLLPVKTIAGAYTLVLADTDSLLKSTATTGVTYTVPLNSSVAFAVGRSISGYQGAAGAITFAGAVGVTINSFAGSRTTGGAFAQWQLFKTGTNEWLLSIDAAA